MRAQRVALFSEYYLPHLGGIELHVQSLARALQLLAAVAEKGVRVDDPKSQPLITRVGVKLFGTENRHSIDKARCELGFVPKVPVREGIKITAEWFGRKPA